MSLQDGMAAMNLEFSARVPRTEYSAEFHWDLIKAVTGINITPSSTDEQRQKASNAFRAAWNYDFVWNILIHAQIFDGKASTMGHANYAAGGEDFDEEIRYLFSEPENVIKLDFWEFYGRRDKEKLVADFETDYKTACENTPDAVNTTGIYVTAMSGLIEILGWDMLLMTAGIYPKEFGEFTNRYADWLMQYFEALAETSFPIVKVHDDIVWTSGAFLQPDWYRKYIFPNYKKYFTPLIEAGKKMTLRNIPVYDAPVFITDRDVVLR